MPTSRYIKYGEYVIFLSERGNICNVSKTRPNPSLGGRMGMCMDPAPPPWGGGKCGHLGMCTEPAPPPGGGGKCGHMGLCIDPAPHRILALVLFVKPMRLRKSPFYSAVLNDMFNIDSFHTSINPLYRNKHYV